MGKGSSGEHERYLVEEHFKRPVILINYPKEIKAFYMKQNDDGKTVKAMDVLFPGIGEIIGGSQREEDYGKLMNRIQELQTSEKGPVVVPRDEKIRNGSSQRIRTRIRKNDTVYDRYVKY